MIIPYDIIVYYKNDMTLELKKKKKNENNFVLDEACIMNFYFRIVYFNWCLDNDFLNFVYTNGTCGIASKMFWFQRYDVHIFIWWCVYVKWKQLISKYFLNVFYVL